VNHYDAALKQFEAALERLGAATEAVRHWSAEVERLRPLVVTLSGPGTSPTQPFLGESRKTGEVGHP
jgi:hypothetical protein